MRRIMQFAPLLGLIAVSACQTVEGAGRDLQTAGQMMNQQYQSQMGQPDYQTPTPY